MSKAPWAVLDRTDSLAINKEICNPQNQWWLEKEISIVTKELAPKVTWKGEQVQMLMLGNSIERYLYF